MNSLRSTIKALYDGQNTRSRRFRYGLILFDSLTIIYFIATAALPVAGNVYMLAQHYNVGPQRVSAAILVSTLLSILSVSLIIAWVTAL